MRARGRCAGDEMLANLLELKNINQALLARQKLSMIDPATILSTFDGHSVFSIYYEDVIVYEQVYN